MGEEKLVSVIIPVYNADKYLKDAVDSILNQTYRNIETIIVNDGSNDNGYSDSIIREYGNRVKYFQKKNGGIADALNYAILHSTGEYIARMDQDDISFPDRIEKQVEFMEKNKEVSVCGTRFYILDQGVIRNAEDYPLTNDEIIVAMLFGNVLCHPSVMFRTSAIKGKWKYEKNAVAEDYNLWLRMICDEKMANLPEKLMLYRMGDTHYTASRTKEITCYSTSIARKAYTDKWGIDVTKYDDEIININEFIEHKCISDKINYLKSAYAFLMEIYMRNSEINIVADDLLKEELCKQWKKIMNKLGFSNNLFDYFGIEYVDDLFSYLPNELEEMVRKVNIGLRNFLNEKKCFRILICGAGKACGSFMSLLKESDIANKLDVVGILDNTKLHFEENGKSWSVRKVCDVFSFEFDYVVISSNIFYQELRNELLEAGVESTRILSRDWVKLCYL